jgi:hypothetical protein
MLEPGRLRVPHAPAARHPRRPSAGSRRLGRPVRAGRALALAMLAAVCTPLLLAGPADAAVGSVTARVVRTVATSSFAPPSPDPAGITYLTHRGRLLLADSEVEEVRIFTGVNLFETTRAGQLTATSATTRFTREPTGLGYRPADRHLFVTDDDADEVHEVAAGADGRYGTADDTRTSFDTRVTGNGDPEGCEVDTSTGHVLVVDGATQEVYDYNPGPNRRFDGVPPAGDDTVRHFDVRRYGALDPEGIGYDQRRGTVLVLDQPSRKIYELTPGGTLLNTIGITATASRKAAGLTMAPASDGSGRWNYFVVDRGVDNDGNPSENDGRLYELAVTLPAR